MVDALPHRKGTGALVINAAIHTVDGILQSIREVKRRRGFVPIAEKIDALCGRGQERGRLC